MTNILPPNASAHEKAMHQAVMSQMPTGRFDEINTYKDPALCPEYLLPYLAWERGVDEWDSQWSTETKRNVIAGAPEEQAHGGTVYALKQALNSLGFGLTLTESWQTDGVPHTFTLFAPLNSVDKGINLSAETYKLIHRKVQRTKPVRSLYALQFGIGFNSLISINGATIAAALARKTARAAQAPVSVSTGFMVAAIARCSGIVQAHFSRISIPDNVITFNSDPITYNNETLVFTPA